MLCFQVEYIKIVLRWKQSLGGVVAGAPVVVVAPIVAIAPVAVVVVVVVDVVVAVGN